MENRKRGRWELEFTGGSSNDGDLEGPAEFGPLPVGGVDGGQVAGFQGGGGAGEAGAIGQRGTDGSGDGPQFRRAPRQTPVKIDELHFQIIK